MNALTKSEGGQVMENVLIKGDLSKLSPQERSQYYLKVCESVGLNPLTKPFEYITLNGKLTLYALRACTDQLRSVHKVSVEELSETEKDGVFVVTAKVRNGDGRTDMAKGAVPITNLKGDALANALMKAETKAKRRATLSICGLGFLDETEIETIPQAAKAAPRAEPAQVVVPAARITHATTAPAPLIEEHDPVTGEVGPREIEVPVKEDGRTPDWRAFGHSFIAHAGTSKTAEEFKQWIEANNVDPTLTLGHMILQAPKMFSNMLQACRRNMNAEEVSKASEIKVEPAPENILAGG